MFDLLTKKTSLTEYLLLPYDGSRTELVNGEIIEMSEASPLHADIIDFLLMLLKAHVGKQGLSYSVRAGNIGIEIPQTDIENNVRDPDLMVCDRAQWRAMRQLTKAVFGAGNPPRLAVEVASSSNKRTDTKNKRKEYALARVTEYWIINPIDGYVLVMTLAGNEYQDVGRYEGDELISSKLFPALKIKAAALLDPDEDALDQERADG